MKNSIMKKTWGILLGFGVSLATAAFVLTGCDIEVKEKETSLDTALVAKWYYGGTGNDAATVGQTAANNGTETYLIFEFTGIASASGGDWAFITGNSSSGKVTGSYSRADNEITLYSSGGSYLGYLKYTVSGTVLTLTNASNDGVKTFEGTYYKAAASSGDDDDDDDTTGGTAQGLADALTALLGSGQSTPAFDVTSTTVAFKANKTVTIPSGTTVTVPTGVTLTVAQSGVSGAKITLSGGTLEVDGILSVQGGDLLFSSTESTIKGEGVIEKNSANTVATVSLATGNKLTIEDVTVKGITTGTQSQPVISVPGTAELTLDGAVVTGNKNTSNGGGISISGTAKVTLLNDAEVKGNTAAKGGGVYLDGSGELHIEKGTVYGSIQSDGTTPETADVKNTATANNGVGGAAIYLNAATTKVYGGSGTHKQELTSEDSSAEADDGLYDEYFKSAGSGSAGYTDTTLSSDGTTVANKAAR